MNSRIILTDIHGCYKTMMALIAKLPSGIPLTFAGDLIDRGPDSRKVIEFVKNGGHDCVVGNHEVMMLSDLKFKVLPSGERAPSVDYYHSDWIHNGGIQCLESYDIEQKQELDSGEIHSSTISDVDALLDHMRWMKSLPYYIEYKKLKNKNKDHLLVTHTTASEVWGNFDPKSDVFKNSVTWERIPFPSKIEGIYNVYGHTPQQYNPTIKDHFGCIDGGGYMKRENYGKLYALQFPEMKIYEQKNIE